MERKLGFGHLGNGISVWDSNSEDSGDYEKIAHISVDREITYYTDKIHQLDKNEIEQQAKTSDPNISLTQEGKVFKSRPELEDSTADEEVGMSLR